MTVAQLLVLLAKQHPDATVYVKDPATDDAISVTDLETHMHSVVLTTEAF